MKHPAARLMATPSLGLGDKISLVIHMADCIVIDVRWTNNGVSNVRGLCVNKSK